MLDAKDGGRLPPRRTVSERAAQRERMEHAGRDRYSSLVRTLQAGQELPWQGKRTGRRLTWHPIARTLLKLIAVAIVLYFAATIGLGVMRDGRVDTWAGPDSSVSSGQRLADCPLVGTVTDDLFPSWIRFGGMVFRLTDSNRPLGFQPGPDTPATDYSLGAMRLFWIANTPEGVAGQIMVIKLDGVAVGRLYRLTPDCS